MNYLPKSIWQHRYNKMTYMASVEWVPQLFKKAKMNGEYLQGWIYSITNDKTEKLKRL